MDPGTQEQMEQGRVPNAEYGRQGYPRRYDHDETVVQPGSSPRNGPLSGAWTSSRGVGPSFG
jgi:hypothetical protein